MSEANNKQKKHIIYNYTNAPFFPKYINKNWRI